MQSPIRLWSDTSPSPERILAIVMSAAIPKCFTISPWRIPAAIVGVSVEESVMRLLAKGVLNTRCLLVFLMKVLLARPPFKTMQCTVMVRSPSSGAVSTTFFRFLLLPTWDYIGFRSISIFSSAIVKFYYEASLMKVEFAEAKSVAVFIPFQSVECREWRHEKCE